MGSINNSTPTHAVTNPAFLGGYVYSDDAIPGVVAANNFLALTNPVGSGRTILIAGAFISQVTTGAVSATAPLRGYIATGVSGGTLIGAALVGKLRSNMPTQVGEIRVGNPTATLGAAWFNSPTLQSTGASSPNFIHQVPASVAAGSLTLLPGESTVLRTEAGSTNTLWNLSLAWSEL